MISEVLFRKLHLSVLVTGPEDPDVPLLILGHGANGGMRHPLLEEAAARLAEEGVGVLRFNFPYEQERKSSPNGDTVLIEVWTSVLTAVRTGYPDRLLFAGGKSLGGRTAAAAMKSFTNNGVTGLVFLGFPLHAPGRAGLERGLFLRELGLPCFFAQGTRDSLANPDLIRKLTEAMPVTTVRFIDGGDHSLRSGDALDGLWKEIAGWMVGLR